ncbi:MAG: multidrug resistance efflux pump [Saprospiraceae bacterium]|jgi:multidrug resistance efflux pump
MATKKSLILQAIAQKKNPSEAHSLLWKYLKKKRFHGLKWLEYQVAPSSLLNKHENEEAGSIVDFYCSRLKWSITISESVPAHANETIVSAHSIIKDAKSVQANIEVEYQNRVGPKETKEGVMSIVTPQLAQGGFRMIEGEIVPIANTTIIQSTPESNPLMTSVPPGDDLYASREELNDLIGNAPGWLLRSGIILIALVTSIVLAMSYFISYPDKILATGIVTTDRPPIQLVAHRTGIIDDILIPTSSIVEKGTPLIYLDNTANENHINQLLQWIEDYQKVDNGIPPPSNLSLGPLQPLHGQLALVYSEYHEVLQQRGTQNQIATISGEMNNISRLNQSIGQEARLYAAEEDLAEMELNRAKLMYNEGLIAKQELELAEAKYNQFLRQLESIDKSQIQNAIRQDQLQLDTKKLVEDRNTTLQQYRFRIQELITSLKGTYGQWLKDNYIYANIGGVIDYSMDVTNHYTVQATQALGHIIPQDTKNQKYVKAIVPAIGIAKLDSTSKAIIKLDAYPYKEYGVLEASIDYMSVIPFRNNEGVPMYQVKIPLYDTLRTTYNQVLAYRPDMTTTVELISEDKSILSRVFDQFLDLIHNK